MKALSLFANIGVAEAYLESINVEVVLANELIKRRAELYSKIYPNAKMICGNILDDNIFEKIVNEAAHSKIDVLIATPPCQGVSRAGKQDEADERNLLIVPVVEMVKSIKPRYVFIENVPQYLDTSIIVDNTKLLITEYIESQLGTDYVISVNLVDTKNYGVPQTRQRCIFLLTRKDQKVIWSVPDIEPQMVTLNDAIGNLPSLDPFIKDVDYEELLEIFPDYEKKKEMALKVSKWHIPPEHIKRQVITMMHTPTGKTAFDNSTFIPIKADGTPVRGYKSTYRRLRWNDPASTVTMDNRKISSQNNVHPGRKIGEDDEDETIFSDARVLSLFELMRIMSLPDDWPLPEDVNVAFVRSIIGEGIPPLFVKKVFEKIRLIDEVSND